MNSQERKLSQRIQLVNESLAEAISEIDDIPTRVRTNKTDELLKKAADMIFSAQEIIGQIDAPVCEDIKVSEKIVFRHRKKKNEA
jgi:uncharacterized membrane protein